MNFFSWLDELVIKYFINHFYDPTETDVKKLPMNQDPVKQFPAIRKLSEFMAAMRDFEGGPNDLNYKNNNPLNCRCSNVGYLPMYGNVQCVDSGKSGKFARFPTYYLGWLYATNLIKGRIKKHPQWTIVDFIGNPTEGWSPASDGNPVTEYAAYIGKRINVDPTTFTISQLV